MYGPACLYFFLIWMRNKYKQAFRALGLFVVSHARCFGQVPKWPKGADCKSVAIGFQGSNPCLPTKAGKF